MRICSPQLGLNPDSFLGGEVHDVNLISQLCKKGVECLVLLPKGGLFPKHPNLQVNFLPFKPIVPPHLFNLVSLPYLFRTYRKEHFSILRLHNPYFLGLAGLVFNFFYPEVKIVTTIHLREDRKDFDIIFRNTKQIYSHFFTVSQYLKKWLIDKYQVEEEKITVIYNGVEGYLKPQKKDMRLIKKYSLEGKKVLLYMGLLNHRKNVLFLVSVLNEVTKRHPDTVLIFIGSGSLSSKINQKALSLGLKDSIRIIKPIKSKEKNSFLNLADIFLFPSTNEGFGLVVVEAMSCGKAVIASKNTSLVELIKDGQTGYLVETNELKKWTGKINFLLDKPQLRKKMGVTGRALVKEEFTWQKVAQKTLEVYKQL